MSLVAHRATKDMALSWDAPAVERVAVVEGAAGALAGDDEALGLRWRFATQPLDQLVVGRAAGAAVQPLLVVDLKGNDPVEVGLEADPLPQRRDARWRQQRPV